MELLLGLVKMADHANVYFVVLVDSIFALFDPFDELLLKFSIWLSWGEKLLGYWQLHKGLVEEYSCEKVKLLFAYGTWFVMFVHDERDPLSGLVPAVAGLQGIFLVQGQSRGAVSEIYIEFLS